MDQGKQVRTGFWLLLSLLAAITSWFYMNRVLVPWEHYFNVEAGTMKAALGDLYSPWYGAQALLLQGKNPYGPEVTHEIQMAFYGHDVVQEYKPGAGTIDEQRFAYPVYVIFLLAPTVHMRFETLQAAAPAALALIALSSLLLWLAVLQWRPPVMATSALALFLLASPQIAQGLRLRQLGMLAAGLLALATWLMFRNHLAAAGMILALATIKPQMVVLPLVWFLLWSLGDLRKRWRLLAGFWTALLLLVGAGELILPGWPRDFVAGLAAYRKYGPVTTLLQLALGKGAGAGAAVVVVAGLLAWGWQNRKHGAASPEFALTLSANLVGASLVLPLMPPFNQVLLLLPALIVVRDWATLPSAARLVFAACVSWPWIASLVLLAVPMQLRSLNLLPLLPSALVLFLPLLLPVLLVARRLPLAASSQDI